jgi:hypothetical protein
MPEISSPLPPTAITTPAPALPEVSSDVYQSLGAPTGEWAPAPQPTPPPRETLGQGFRRGLQGETYAVDAQGNVVNARTTSPSRGGVFGQILAGVVMGALAGATPREGGYSVGTGAREARTMIAEQDERRRREPQQNLQNRMAVTESQNRDLRFKAEIHIANLNAIHLAHEIDVAQRDDPLRHQQLVNATTVSALALENETKNLGLINERTYDDYEKVSKADIDRFNRHEVKLMTLADGTVKVWDRTFDTRVTPNTEDFEIKDLTGLDPKTGKPAWKVVGHVKAGQGTVAQLEAELNKERVQLIDTAEKNARTGKDVAEAERARAGAAKDYSVAEMSKLMIPGAGGNEADANVLLDAAYNLQVDPVKVTSLRTNARQAFFQRLMTRHPDFNQGAWTIAMDAKKDYTGGGKVGQNLGNFSTAIEHLDQLSHVYEAMQGGDVQLVNRLVREAGYQTGATPVASWNIMVNALSDELERAYTGVGATQEGARQMREGFAKSLSQGQARTAIQTAMATLKSRENSLRNNFVNAMPSWFAPEKRQPEAQGINLVSPQASSILQRWGFKADASGTVTVGHVIEVGGKHYRYNGSGDTADMKNYTEVKQP